MIIILRSQCVVLKSSYRPIITSSCARNTAIYDEDLMTKNNVALKGCAFFCDLRTAEDVISCSISNKVR